MRRFARSVFLVALALMPAKATAQSAIAGLVTDTTGAVMPGVTIEAASPVLIEKARSVVTDSQGRYTIVDLRPGTYTVTFTLPGFSTVKREGLELPANFTATANAELRVGALEETVTVSGATPAGRMDHFPGGFWSGVSIRRFTRPPRIRCVSRISSRSASVR